MTTRRVVDCFNGLALAGVQPVVRLLAGESDHLRRRQLAYAPFGGVFQVQTGAAGTSVRLRPGPLPRFNPVWVFALARRFRADHIDAGVTPPPRRLPATRTP